jgi:hypothetical protein
MKFSFDYDGFLALQNELFQMDDEALKIESDLILDDFISWLCNYFMLDENQLIFFHSLDEKAKRLLCIDISFAIENRLPIGWQSPDKINQQQVISSKISIIKSRLAGYNDSGILLIYINCKE